MTEPMKLVVRKILKMLISPFYIMIMLPVEYDLWKAYRKRGSKKTLVGFIISRM